MTDFMDLIQVEGCGDRHVNLWVKGPAGEDHAVVVRHGNGDLFVQVRGKSTPLTKDEMRAFGIACLRLAGEWRPEDD